MNVTNLRPQIDRLNGMVNHLGNTNAQLTVQLAEMTVIANEKQREIERLTAELKALRVETAPQPDAIAA